jgi:tetratricopeptide (TPR) repeat protein
MNVRKLRFLSVNKYTTSLGKVKHYRALYFKDLDKKFYIFILNFSFDLISLMDIDLAQRAVSAALESNWEEAVRLNEEILKNTPSDIDALNRLSRAYSELGNLPKAKKAAEKVLKLDPFNTIASKALARWKGLKKAETQHSSVGKADAFLEESGRTKIVPLLHLGDKKLIAKLDAGDEVALTTHSHRISVVTLDGKHIGKLPDDISARLRKLISLGNEYQVLMKSIEPNEVKVFIREAKRGKKASNVASFPPEKIDYVSFTPPELVHKKDVVIPSPEEE